MLQSLWFLIKRPFWYFWPFKGLDDTRGGPFFISPSQSLFQSASSGNGPALQLAFFLGANPNVTNRDGWTPLYQAHPSVVSYLVKKGANLEHRNQHGCTPLLAMAYWPAWSDTDARITAFIAAGADETATDPDGLTWQACRAVRACEEAITAQTREAHFLKHARRHHQAIVIE